MTWFSWCLAGMGVVLLINVGYVALVVARKYAPPRGDSPAATEKT